MRIFRIIFIAVLTSVLTSCYQPSGTRTVLPFNITWTGTGDYSAGNSASGIVIALAGQDMYWFQENGGITVDNDVLVEEFPGPYRLTSVAQTFSLGFHEQSFLHGNLVGQTNNLDIFHTQQFYFGPRAGNRIRPADSLTVIQNGLRYNVVEICDMATPDQADGWVLPFHDESHLLMSVRACTDTGRCAGGVIEAAIDHSFSWWRIKGSGSTQHAMMKRTNGRLFSNECMPIAATRRSKPWSATYSLQEYVFLGDPSTREITVFDAQNLQNGPLDSMQLPVGRRIRDITAEGTMSSPIHTSLVSVLSENSGPTAIDHFSATNGGSIGPKFLTDTSSSNTQKLQGFGRGSRNEVTGTGDLLTFGNSVVRRSYRKRNY